MKLLVLLSLLAQLDSLVTEQAYYTEQHLERIATAEQAYYTAPSEAQSALALELYELYYGFDNDSAIVWAKRGYDIAESQSNTLLVQQSVIAFSHCLSISGEYAMAYQLMNPLESELLEEVKPVYYTTLYYNAYWQAKYSTLPQIREKAERDKQVLLEKVRQYAPDKLSEVAPRTEEQLIEAAINHIKEGKRDPSALRELTTLLYQKGDIYRAYNYMQCCIENARESKAHLFAVELANDIPQILNAYDEHIRQQDTNRKRLIISLLIATIILLLALLLITRLFIRYNHANRLLRTTNTQLIQSNRIRDTYLTRYMQDCSSIIEAMDSYRKRLIHVSEQPQKLFQMVKSSEATDEMLRTFYQRFDESFLSLFPDFIQCFNTLLRPEEAFPIPENPRLTTELRIYALIRLGVTESAQIAQFLRLSPKTVQNNRAMVRNRALGDRELLDEQVQHIGTIAAE